MDMHPLAAIIARISWAMGGKDMPPLRALYAPKPLHSRLCATLRQALLLCMSGRVEELHLTSAKLQALLEELLERELYMVGGRACVQGGLFIGAWVMQQSCRRWAGLLSIGIGGWQCLL